MSNAEVLYVHDSNNYTPDEPWTTRREYNHWYSLQADYAKDALGRGPGSLLVIGSPIFEALEFEDGGWDVTYLDVREPPLIKNWLKGDASIITLPPETFDAVSSTCVLCHVGMGRYGDASVDDAESKVLSNIHHTLKKNGLASITFGPVSAAERQIRLSNMQRVFTVDSAKRLALLAGFRIEDLKILDTKTALWVEKKCP